MKKLALIASLVSTLLAGCATNNNGMPPEEQHNSFPYNENISRANNINWVFWQGTHSDETAPKGFASNDGSLLLDTAGWASSIYSAAGSSFLPGSSSVGTSIGIGFVLALTSMKNPFFNYDQALMAYLPAQDASNKNEAQKIIIDRALESFGKAFKALYPDAEIEIRTDKADAWVYTGSVDLVSDELGCHYNKWSARKRCAIEILGHGIEEKPRMTSVALGTPFEAWVADRWSISLNFLGGQSQKIDWLKVVAAVTPYLPEHTYASIVSRDLGNRKYSAPFVLEKNRINYFVMPAEVLKKNNEKAK